MGTPTQLGHDLVRILLYRRDATEILVETTTEGCRFPILPIRAHRREAEEVTGAIRTSWNLETYGLFRLPAAATSPPCVHNYVVEACRPDADCPSPMEWMAVHRLLVDAFLSAADLDTIQNSLRILDQFRRDELPGPFGKPGWLRTVTEWVDSQARATGRHLTGAVRQFNARQRVSLLRFETDGPALWFKAVGEPNLQEYPITLELARCFPLFVPRIIATHEDWNAWISLEADGTHPDQNSDLDTWKRIAAALGELQIASFGQTLHLLGVGCRDVGTRALLEVVAPFLDTMAELMGRQPKPSAASLSRSEFTALRMRLEDVLSEVADTDIPNSIGHLDFNPGNIVVSSTGCTFLDWAEACAGYPFLAIEYLLEHARRSCLPDPSWRSQLLSVY